MNELKGYVMEFSREMLEQLYAGAIGQEEEEWNYIAAKLEEAQKMKAFYDQQVEELKYMLLVLSNNEKCNKGDYSLIKTKTYKAIAPQDKNLKFWKIVKNH